MPLNQEVLACAIFDTNPGLRNEMQAEFKKAGIKVLKTFASVKVGYDFLVHSQEKCDLIVSDLRLEDATVVQLLSNLRPKKRFSKTHVALIADAKDLSLAQETLSFGVMSLSFKPIGSEALLNQLRQQFAALDRYNGNSTL